MIQPGIEHGSVVTPLALRCSALCWPCDASSAKYIYTYMLFNHFTHTTRARHLSVCVVGHKHLATLALTSANHVYLIWFEIELGSICDAWRAANPASPSPHWFLGALKDELRSTVQLVVVKHLQVDCQPPYKVQRRRSLMEERWLEINLVYPFMWGFICRSRGPCAFQVK